MPALYTHYAFSLYAEPAAGKSTLVGGQGPDIFFFYGMYPFRKADKALGKAVNAFGTRMHKVDPAPYYVRLFQIAKESEDFELLDPYIDGVLLHYALDSVVHPYVFYRSGKSYEPKLSVLYSRSHCFFETLLDIEVKQKYGVDLLPHRCLDMDKKTSRAASKLWQKMNDEMKVTDDHLTDDCFEHGLSDYASVERFLLSKTGIKRFFIGLFGGKKSQPYCLCYPPKLGKYQGLDFMNLKKKEWAMPVSGSPRNESVPELFDIANVKYLAMKDLKKRCYEGEDVLEEFKKITQGINHDGTLEGEKMSHMKLIWEER